MRSKITFVLFIIIILASSLEAQEKVTMLLNEIPTQVQVGEIITINPSFPTDESSSFLVLTNPLIYESNSEKLFTIISITRFEIKLKAAVEGKTSIKIKMNGELQDKNGVSLSNEMKTLSAETKNIQVVSATQENLYCGDVNSDKGVDIIDANLVAQYYVGNIPTLENLENADVSNDNAVTIDDALLLARYSVGEDVTLSCPPKKRTDLMLIGHDGGIQCQQIFFETANEAKEELEYFGIDVLSIERQTRPVNAVCGIPDGVLYVAKISEKDLSKVIMLGWYPVKKL